MPKTLLVVGSVALDTVETPFGREDDVLGGSATYFSWAASFYVPVRLVGVVGEDFPADYRRLLESRKIDLAGLETQAGGTFRWEGAYEGRMNTARTLSVKLNVLEKFIPNLSPEFRDSRIIFLANDSPATQLAVLEQAKKPDLVAADTMNCWINTAKDKLVALLGRLDGLFLNDEEARMLTGRDNLLGAGKKILQMGPRFVVIKKGEHGAILASRRDRGGDDVVALPAFPCENVVDPTGAGDSFAGAMMGCIAKQENWDLNHLKRAMAYAMVTASFAVEDFSLRKFQQIGLKDIEQRLEQYRRMLQL